jgi:hypothetical protein
MMAGPAAAGRSRTRFIGLTARGACLACEAVVRGGYRDVENPFLEGSIGEVCLFTRPRAQLNAARPRPSALLTTASQARHAPRLAPYVDAHGQLPDPYRAWILVPFATRLDLLRIFFPWRPNPAQKSPPAQSQPIG